MAAVFVCPICRQSFVEQDVLGPGLKVDIAHAYPQQIGGPVYALECKRCNGRLNAAADNALVIEVQQWRSMFGQKGTPFRGRLDMPSGPVNVSLARNILWADPRRSHPAAIREFAELPGVQLDRVVLERPDPGRLSLALLHAAHIILFREFGYGYLGTAYGLSVARLLDRCEQLDDPPFRIMQVTSGTFNPAFLLKVCRGYFSDGTRELAVCIPQHDGTSMAQFLVLDGFVGSRGGETM